MTSHDDTVRSEAGDALTQPKILFLTRSLNRGGAERQLVALAIALHRSGWKVAVACLYAGGRFEDELARAGVCVMDLHKRGRWDLFGFGGRLLRAIRSYNADIVHGYTPVPNMLALSAKLVRRGTPVVWGVRASEIDFSKFGRVSVLAFRASCLLSRFASLIIANSQSGADYHVSRGYPVDRMVVIPNGIDVERFRYVPEGRATLRRLWHISDGEVLVGLIGRLDPLKDHATFLRAASILAMGNRHWRFVCVGDGPRDYAEALAKEAEGLGLDTRMTWAGVHDNMAAVYSALDVAVSSSISEGFPNVIAEAMACGSSCVVTDVGDSAMIVGELGVVVRPRDPVELASGIERLYQGIRSDKSALAVACRTRIVYQYSVVSLAQCTEATLKAMHRRGGGP